MGWLDASTYYAAFERCNTIAESDERGAI